MVEEKKSECTPPFVPKRLPCSPTARHSPIGLPSALTSSADKTQGHETSQSFMFPAASAEKASRPCARVRACTVVGCARQHSRSFRWRKSKTTTSPRSPPLIRLLPAEQCTTHRPPSGCAAHEATSACEGGNKMSQRHKLFPPLPGDSPTLARITELST